MQLVSKRYKNLVPITLTAGLAISAFPYAYADFNQSNLKMKSNSSNINDILQVSKDFEGYGHYSLKNFLDHKTRSWMINIMFFSNTLDMVNEKNFKDIVSMGEFIVPFIIEKIKLEPSPLVWALNIIYNQKITEKKITIEKACKLWVAAMS